MKKAAKTKLNILDAALKCFNEAGIVNVRLQHIADEAFVSVGNLAYHFPNKEAITHTLYQDLTQKQEALLAQYRAVPLFVQIDLLLQHSFKLQQAYIFFYLDTLEIIRAYPKIAQKHQQHISFQITQMHQILNFNAARGALKPEQTEGTYRQLALQVWMTMDLLLTQFAIRSQPNPEEAVFKGYIWALLRPYFSNMGEMEYKQMNNLPSDLFF